VLLGFRVRPIADEHLTIGLRPQRLRVDCRMQAANVRATRLVNRGDWVPLELFPAGSRALALDSHFNATLRGFAVSAFVFGLRSLKYIPDGSEFPIGVGLQDQRATAAKPRFIGR
jgi:hypothetical protein